MVISEDIIKKALNESIEEFMINEANWGKAFSNAWNGVKNAAAEYMNWRTNGQWNQKYGINPSYNLSQFSELRYLYQWFTTQKQTLQSILNPQSPSQISRDNTKINQYEGKPNDFIARECTYQNFTKWAGQYIKNYNGLKLIDEYIYNYITKNYQSPQTAMQYMDLNTFIKQTDYYNNSTSNRKSTTKKQELQKEVSDVYNFFKQLKQMINRVINNNIEDLPNFIEFNFNNFFNTFFKIYLLSNDQNIEQRLSLIKKYVLNQWSQWKTTIQNDPSKANMFANWIDYNQFFNNKEGKQYWYLQRQTGAYGKKNVY